MKPGEMATDTLVGVESFDEAVRRIMVVFRELASQQNTKDVSAALTELQVRQCLDELLCCYELQTQETLSGERLHHKRLRRSHESRQRRADMTSNSVVDEACGNKASAAEGDLAMQLRTQAELKQTEQELTGRERDIENLRRDLDALNLKLKSREDTVSQRELAVQARESDLDERERNVAVHELMMEEDQRLSAAQREALERDQQQHVQQQACCVEARPKPHKCTEDVVMREPSAPNLEVDAPRLPKPLAPSKVGASLAGWGIRLAERDRALAESHRDQAAEERKGHDQKHRLDDVEVPQMSTEGNHQVPRSIAPAAQPAVVHYSRPESVGSLTRSAHGAHCGAKKLVAEPHRATSAFARFAAPLTRFLVSGEEPTSPS